MTLWQNLSLPWQACMEMAWEAYCDDCLPIGAAIVDANNNIISRGRNRIYEKVKANGHMSRGAQFAHAEMEALHAIDNYDAIAPHTCALYTTTEPCPMCLGAFYMSGIRTLHYASREPWAGSADLLGKTWYLSHKPIKVFAPPDPALEIIIMALMVERDYQAHDGHLPDGAWGSLYKRWSVVVPQCLPLGKLLYDERVLLNLRGAHVPAAEMVDTLAERIKL
jgi:tRNA(adenine34) deaminase